MNAASTCSHCNGKDHSVKKCPSLHDVLNDGFYSGGNGGGGHDHDEEERVKPCARIPYASSYRRPFSCVDQDKNERNVQSRQSFLYLACLQ